MNRSAALIRSGCVAGELPAAAHVVAVLSGCGLNYQPQDQQQAGL